eukprot:1109972-Pleurochrysis_carterae.AAC.2
MLAPRPLPAAAGKDAFERSIAGRHRRSGRTSIKISCVVYVLLFVLKASSCVVRWAPPCSGAKKCR